MKTYKLRVYWTMCATVEAEGENLYDAIERYQGEPLPTNGEYIEGSFEVESSDI